MSLLSKAKAAYFAKIQQIDALWRSSFWLLVMRVVNLGAMLLLSILLSRHLGAEQYGVFAFGMAVLMIAVVPARFGFDHYLASEIPALTSATRFSEIRGLVRRAYQTTVVVSLGLLALWLAFWAVAPAALSRPLWTSGAITLAALPCFALLHTRYGALRGQHRPVAGQLPIFVLQPLLAIALAVLALLLAPAAINGVAAQVLFAASAVAVCVLAFAGLNRSSDAAWGSAKPNYATRQWLRSAAPMMLASGFSIVIAQAGVFLLGAQLGERAAGLYQPAAQLAGFIPLALQMVNHPLAPRISQLYTERRFAELQALISRVSVVCLGFALLLAIILFVWGKELLSIYSAEFSAAAPAMAILALGQLVNVACGPTAMALMMTRNAMLVAKLMAFGAVLCVALSASLIPAFELEGAAIGASVSLIVWNAVAAWFLLRRTGLYSSVLVRALPISPAGKQVA